MFRHLVLALVVSAVMAVAAVSQGAPARTASQPKLPPLTILSIIPAQGEPGMTVTLNGTGFTSATAAVLGNVQLPTAVQPGGKILTFELPDFPAGAYALYLRRDDGSTSRPFNFMLQPLRPSASGLSPDTVYACSSGREREVTVTGANFLTGSRILLDGAAVSTRFVSAGALAFIVPQLPSGLHQVQVKNGDALSGTLALFIDTKPEILSAAIGTDYVSAYDLVINGRNFQQSSVLVADGQRLATGTPVPGGRDQLFYFGCGQLVYQRHPYDPTPKEIRLQVINPNGEESSVFSISAP